ncbi:MAG: hypothetical protein ACRCUY_05755 [Thermoguttaceae bacterium]
MKMMQFGFVAVLSFGICSGLFAGTMRTPSSDTLWSGLDGQSGPASIDSSLDTCTTASIEGNLGPQSLLSQLPNDMVVLPYSDEDTLPAIVSVQSQNLVSSSIPSSGYSLITTPEVFAAPPETPVSPEPSTFFILAVGLSAVPVFRRFRRQ